MLKFISAVIAAAAFAGVLTLLSATSTRLDAGPARDVAPQSSPFTQTAPTLAATAISPELVRLEVARDLAAMRDSIDQLAAQARADGPKYRNTAGGRAGHHTHEVIPPRSEAVSPPPRKKARRVGKLAAQSSSVPTAAFLPQ
jgi:hypothetical protein